MSEIYQIPTGDNNTVPAWLPALNNNGGFGNNGLGGGILGFLLGLVFGNGGFGNFGGTGNQASNFLMEAINNSGERSASAIQALSTTLNQDFNLVNSGVQTISGALATLSAQHGLTGQQIINSIQAGDSSLANQLQTACCSMQNALNQTSSANQLAICQQTNTLQTSATSNTQAILNKLGDIQTQSLQDKLEASRLETSQLRGELSQSTQNALIANMITNAVTPIAAQLAGIRSEVDAIKRCQPATITIPNNSMTAVPTIWANAVADNIVDRIQAALTPTTTTNA